MFTITRRLSPSDAMAVEVPALAASLVIAETCYKFHSFLLEASAFLVTWWVLGAGLSLVRRAVVGTPREA